MKVFRGIAWLVAVGLVGAGIASWRLEFDLPVSCGLAVLAGGGWARFCLAVWKDPRSFLPARIALADSGDRGHFAVRQVEHLGLGGWKRKPLLVGRSAGCWHCFEVLGIGGGRRECRKEIASRTKTSRLQGL